MSNYNNVTGDKLISKVNTKSYDENYDFIFKTKAPLSSQEKRIAIQKNEEVKYNFKEITDD